MSYSYETKDCGVRAHAIAFNYSYKTSHRVLSRLGRKPRQGTHNKHTSFLVDMFGGNKRYKYAKYKRPTVEQFLENHQEGIYLLHVQVKGKGVFHLTTVKDGIVYDIGGFDKLFKWKVYHYWKVK